MAVRLLPYTWVRYRVQIEGTAELQEGVGFKSFISDIKIEPPRWKRIIREPLNEYVIALIRLDGDKYQYRTMWLDGDERKTQTLLDGATGLIVLLFTIYNNKVYLKDDYPGRALSPGNHVLSLVIRRTVDGSDADKTDITFKVNENGLQVVKFGPSSE
jgi:hypothetical protein